MAGYDVFDIVKEVVENEWWFTTVVDEIDEEILKRGFTRAIRDYPKKAYLVDIEFWDKYAGVSKSKSLEINSKMFEMILDGRWKKKDVVLSELMKFGIDRKQAELIAKTELNNIANIIREEAYKVYTNAKVFKWVIEDEKACEKCKELARRTASGVSLIELKKLVKEVGGRTAREWVIHPGCRCTFIKARGKRREWEKGVLDILKYKRYIRDIAEAPEGVVVRRGPRGGLWYETEERREFFEEIEEIRRKVISEVEITENDLKIAEEVRRTNGVVLDEVKKILYYNSDVLGVKGMSYRVKDQFSIIGKAKKKYGGDYSKVKDIIGIRLVYGSIMEMYDSISEVKEVLKQIYGEKIEFVDDDKVVKNKGRDYYRAYHVDVAVKIDGKVYNVELQLHDVNVLKIINIGHKLVYKNVKNLDEEARAKVKDCLVQWSEYYLKERKIVRCSCEENIRKIFGEYGVLCEYGG